MAYWKKVEKKKCELEGPYECPHCGGHIMLDATYLDQIEDAVRCPYCLDTGDRCLLVADAPKFSVPEEDEMDIVEAFLKKMEDPNLPEDYTFDDFYDEIGIPRKDRSDFGTAALLKQVQEAREAKDVL